MDPIERFEDKWHRCRPPAAEDQRADWDTLRIVGLRRKHRVIRHRDCETAIRMGRLFLRFGRPLVSFPIESFLRNRTVFSFPPDIPIWKKRDVSIDRVSG